MLRTPKEEKVRVSWGILLAFIFLTASCSGPAAPAIDQPQLSTSIEPVTNSPASIPKISAGQHLRFERISLEQGLSQNAVYSILQDSQGFMWFGTEGGLNKYDGYNFTIYQHDPDDPNSPGTNWISTMFEDDSGLLWIGTGYGGLDHYDRKLDQFTHYQNDPDDPFSLSNDEITAIYQGRNGVIWIGTRGGGLDRFDRENERFIHYQHDPGNPNSLSSNAVSAIYEDLDGVLWIGTDNEGLNRLFLSQGDASQTETDGFERENERWWHYRNDPSNPHSLSSDSITAISEDQSGSLWIGTNGGGLERLVPNPAMSPGEGFAQENAQFIHYQHDPDDRDSLSDDDITAIFQDRDGILWIGTYFGGLNRFDPEKEIFIHYQNVPGDPHSLSSNFILSISQTREGELWFGTLGGGVNKLDLGRWNFAHYKNDPENPNSLSDNMVWALNQGQDGVIWIGTMSGGLDRFDRETGNWAHYRYNPDDSGSLSNDWVAAIYEDQDGALWIGTRSGLDKFNSQTDSALGEGTFTHYQPDADGLPRSRSNDITAIYPGQDGIFWIGTVDGLYRFDREKESWSHLYRHDPGDPESQSNVVLSILEDQDGVLWIGTIGGGLNRFDPEKETFTHYQNDPDDPHSLSNDIVLSIIQDHKGALWIGTPGGLNRFDQGTETFTRYREKDGMADDNVYCMVEDGGGYLWLSTNKGLSKFDPQRETFRHYDVTNGLQSNEFNITSCYISDSEEVFFGGINGFNTFFPNQIIDNPTIPPIVLTSLAHNGEDVDLGISVNSITEATFKWPDNSFEFEFAALSYSQPEKNQYDYKLVGFDKEWNEIGTRRYGKYTNLPGGTYTLILRGSNNYGVWNEAGTEVQITIVPPFWETLWFQAFVFLIVLGGAIGGYRLRVRTLETRGRELESLVEQRTAELMKIEKAVRQSEMEKAITSERNRLARDLHDSVTQALYSQTLYAEATSRLLTAGELQTAAEYVGELQQTAQQALQEMRLLIFELRPTVLAEDGIVAAMQMRLESVEERSGFTTEIKVNRAIELPPNIEEGLYWISLEALNNIVKHAGASQVTVILEQEQHTITLEIIDDGSGFDPEKQSNHGGLGLRGIQERVNQLGGQITIESQSGEGTRLHVEVGL